jgi:zinc and cadmium transporter
LGKVTHDRLQLYLSLAAGFMLGAAFFHVMPDAMEKAGETFGWWMALGVVGLFGIERFIAPHSHEMDGGHHHDHHDHAGAGEHEHCDHAHEHGEEHHHEGAVAVKDRRAAAPAVAGWMAVVGLTLHTFINGVGLAGAVQASLDEAQKNGASTSIALMFPGLALFLAIVLHKPADALAISTVLSRKGVSRQKISLVQLGFALMVPVGVIAFHVAHDMVQKGMENQLTGAALAISAGTFLFIALSDLLPEVQFHRHDRIQLFSALVIGVIFMGMIAWLEPHEESDAKGQQPAAGQTKQ